MPSMKSNNILNPRLLHEKIYAFTSKTLTFLLEIMQVTWFLRCQCQKIECSCTTFKMKSQNVSRCATRKLLGFGIFNLGISILEN